jgi:hypothetical protein
VAVTNSRVKGANYEREVRDDIRDFGFEAERDGQTRVRRFDGEPNLDVRHTIPGLHVEAKRQEAYLIDRWWAQAVEDSAKETAAYGETVAPCVVFRKSKTKSRALVPWRWLLAVMRELVDLRADRDWLVAHLDPQYADEWVEMEHARA